MSKKYKIFLLVSIILFLFSFGVYFFKNTELGRASVSGVINAPVKLTGLSAPTGSNDASTKGYVDAASSKPGSWNCQVVSSTSGTATCPSGYTMITYGCYGYNWTTFSVSPYNGSDYFNGYVEDAMPILQQNGVSCSGGTGLNRTASVWCCQWFKIIF